MERAFYGIFIAYYTLEQVLCYLLKKYFFIAVLGLHCCTRAFSSCGALQLLCIVVCGLLIAGASLVAEHGLQAGGLQ